MRFTAFLETRLNPGMRGVGRELRAHVLLGPDPRKMEILGPGPRKVKNLGPGPTGPRPGVFFTNIQHPVCTWTYRDHGLTTYN
jgi:hypothetical protein